MCKKYCLLRDFCSVASRPQAHLNKRQVTPAEVPYAPQHARHPSSCAPLTFEVQMSNSTTSKGVAFALIDF
jgi:hypothetical protein